MTITVAEALLERRDALTAALYDQLKGRLEIHEIVSAVDAAFADVKLEELLTAVVNGGSAVTALVDELPGPPPPGVQDQIDDYYTPAGSIGDHYNIIIP